MSALAEAVIWAKRRLYAASRVTEPWRPWTRFPPEQTVDLPGYARPRAREIALTFDDGPHPVHTPALLKVLTERRATATFFMCGSAMAEHPEVVKQVAAGGHVVGGHTWSHRVMTGLDEPEIADELDRTHELIERLTGQQVTLFRPPQGAHDSRVLAALRQRALTPVLWAVDSYDWLGNSADAITDHVARASFPGAIVLLHDSRAGGTAAERQVSRAPTVEAVRTMLCSFEASGIEVRALRPVGAVTAT